MRVKGDRYVVHEHLTPSPYDKNGLAFIEYKDSNGEFPNNDFMVFNTLWANNTKPEYVTAWLQNRDEFTLRRLKTEEPFRKIIRKMKKYKPTKEIMNEMLDDRTNFSIKLYNDVTESRIRQKNKWKQQKQENEAFAVEQRNIRMQKKERQRMQRKNMIEWIKNIFRRER